MEIKSTRGLHTSSIKCIVYGDSGAGKTSLIGTLPEREILIISAESGLLSLDDKDIDSLSVSTFSEARESYAIAKNSDYNTIAIDSLTEISDMLVSQLEKLPEFQDPKMTMKMWGVYNKTITAFIKSFRALDKNVVFTALAEDVNDGGVIIKKPFIKGTAAQKMLASYFDEVFYLSTNEQGERSLNTLNTHSYTAKDRSGKLEATEEANLQSIFNKIKGEK